MGTIRFLLAIAVLLSHMPDLGTDTYINRESLPIKVWSGHAVFAFFIISGFYVSLILNEKYTHLENGVKRFYFNRALRLYPGHWFILSGYAIAFIVSGTPSFIIGDFLDKELLSVFAIFSNVFFFGSELIGFNDVSNWYYVIGPIWSLSVEAYFYILAPFLVTRPLKQLLIITGFFLILRISLYWSGSDLVPWRYFYFPSVLVFFLIGSLSYRAYIFIKDKNYAKPLGFIMFVMMMFYMGITELWVYGDLDMMGSWAFYILVFISTPFIFVWSKRSTIDNFIGQLTYPIYISHMLIILIVSKIDTSIDKGVLAVIGALIISLFMYLAIDKVIDHKLRAKISGN